MEQDPMRVCELSVGLGDVDVVGLEDEATEPLVVHIQARSRPMCWGCGGSVWSKGTNAVRLVAFGRAVRFVCRRSGVRFVYLSAFGRAVRVFVGVRACGSCICRRTGVRFVYLSAFGRAVRVFVGVRACGSCICRRTGVRFVCRRSDVRRGWCDASGVRVAQVVLSLPGGGLWGRLVHRDQRRDRTGSFGVDIPGGALGDDSGGS